MLTFGQSSGIPGIFFLKKVRKGMVEARLDYIVAGV